MNAIADATVDHLKKHKIRPLSVEGTGEGHWVLLDYGDVIIHIFYEPVREFYDLEGLWVDAARIVTPSLNTCGRGTAGVIHVQPVVPRSGKPG